MYPYRMLSTPFCLTGQCRMKHYTNILFLVVLTISHATFASPQQKYVAINGVVLNQEQIAALESQIGTAIIPGNYLVDPQSGCWANLNTGQQGCMNQNGVYTSRYGSGEWNSNGDWSHYSDAADGAVGGSGDGCVYAFGWSNC